MLEIVNKIMVTVVTNKMSIHYPLHAMKRWQNDKCSLCHYFYNSAEGKIVCEAMTDIRQKMEKEKANPQPDRYNQYVKQYNILVEKYNTLNNG